MRICQGTSEKTIQKDCKKKDTVKCQWYSVNTMSRFCKQRVRPVLFYVMWDERRSLTELFKVPCGMRASRNSEVTPVSAAFQIQFHVRKFTCSAGLSISVFFKDWLIPIISQPRKFQIPITFFLYFFRRFAAKFL